MSNLVKLIIVMMIGIEGCVSQQSTEWFGGQPSDVVDNNCAEEKKVASDIIRAIAKYQNYTDFSIEDVRFIVHLLRSSFNIDSGGCSGFTEAVQSKAKELILEKRQAFLDPLEELCSQDIPSESRNLVRLSALINEVKTSTFILQNLLDVDTSSCNEVDTSS